MKDKTITVRIDQQTENMLEAINRLNSAVAGKQMTKSESIIRLIRSTYYLDMTEEERVIYTPNLTL